MFRDTAFSYILPLCFLFIKYTLLYFWQLKNHYLSFPATLADLIMLMNNPWQENACSKSCSSSSYFSFRPYISLHWRFYFYSILYDFIYLLIFGHSGSSLLNPFLYLPWAGVTLQVGCTGFSLWWHLSLQSMRSGALRFQQLWHVGSVAVLSGFRVQAQ